MNDIRGRGIVAMALEMTSPHLTGREITHTERPVRRIPSWMAIATAMVAAGVASAAAAAAAAQGRPSIDQSMAQLSAVRRYNEAVISPDGKMVAWVESLPTRGDHPSEGTAIYIAAVTAGAARVRVSAITGTAPHDEHGVAWSPDSRRVAFLSDAASAGQLQLYVASATGGPARKLTSIKGYLATPQWSPNGETIGILFTEDAPRASGPLQPRTVDVGVVEDHYFEQRLATVAVASGQLRQLTPADLYVYEYDWSTDGKQCITTAAHGEGDDNWYLAELYTVDMSTGDTRSIYKPTMQVASPRWSPDAKSVAFVGGIMSDEGIASGDIFTIPVTGGTPRNLTPDMKASAYWLSWQTPDAIHFAAAADGQSAIGRVSPSGGDVQFAWKGAETIHGAANFSIAYTISRDLKTTALVRESFAQPPEVWAGQVGEWRQITSANAGQHPLWGEAKDLHWTSDQFTVQGWLVYPKDFDPSRKYPMVVYVHGGPEGVATPSWPETFGNGTILANEGYFVFYPNFRGSAGQAESFTRANVKDFGGGDLRDILTGVDEVVRSAPVDNARIGITGWSYGGYMTMWAVTQTHRFRAAVSGAGLADWLSYYGENGIDKWMDAYFGGNVYDDPAVYAKSSPITFIKNAQTPTLIVVGDRDIECPPPQSYEFWHALKTFGVKTQFVIYPVEGHEIGQPEHRRDIMRRMAAWFDDNMKPE
jgi:dipeptidyl aminopeptidase/acylaminoacyl peptidase